MVRHEVISDVNAACLRAFQARGGGALPYPGSERASLDLWYACNLERSAAAEQPPLLSRLADALIGGGQPPWRGLYSQQVRHTYCTMFDGFGCMPRGTNETLRHGVL